MEIGLLGPLTARDPAGATIPIRGRRVRTLLAVLALEAGHVVPTSTLVDRIWGEQPPDGAANALQALVSRLRRQLPDGTIDSHSAGYRLTLPAEAVDVHRFTALVGRGRATLADDPAAAAATLDRALALWRGAALTDIGDGHAPTAEVTRLNEWRLAATEDWADAHLRAGSARRVVADLEALVTAHPTRERAVGLLMRTLCAAGRSGDALQVYDRTRAILADRLGADPSPDLIALHRRILRGDPALVPATAPDGHRHNLRAELTSFVGRETDVARIEKLLNEARLITLTGPGGAGKTRLAAEAARRLVTQVPDGVWLVELAPLSDPAELPYAVLVAMGFGDQVRLRLARGGEPGPDQPTGDDPTERLARALSDRNALLLLDNCEHLVTAAAALAHRLLASCPRLRILATSREPLGITGESLWPVDPLAAPPPDLPAAAAATYPALRLLADRAAAARPDFVLDDRSIATAVRICRALDGMPLAIELAAARLRTMTLDQLCARLDDRFQVLNGGSRTAQPRHQTLRAMVDWSWDLLDTPERTLLRRLAVFTGGVPLAAAEAICADSQLPAPQVFDVLTALADKSLLSPDPAATPAQPRFRILETIKAYGAARLAEAGETNRFQAAHTRYFRDLAETAEPWLRTGEQRYWLARLAADTDNIHAALRRAICGGDTDTAVRLVAALGWYWSLTGRRLEGIDLAQQTFALAGDASDEARALAYTVSACATVDSVEPATSERWFATAAELAARSDQRHPMLRMVGPLRELFHALSHGALSPAGRPVLPRTQLARLADDPDPWVRGTVRVLGVHVALLAGDSHGKLMAQAREALSAFQSTGDQWGEASARHIVAELAALEGDLNTAVAENRQAMAMVTPLGIWEDKLLFQIRLAEQLWALGERRHAAAELAIADRDAERLGLPTPQISVACAAADLARLAGDLTTARAELARAAANADTGWVAPEVRGAVATALVQLAVAEGDLELARQRLAPAVALITEARSASATARLLVATAALALAEPDPVQAARLLGASEAARGGPDRSLPDATRIAVAARAALGEERFAEAHSRGHLDLAACLAELGIYRQLRSAA